MTRSLNLPGGLFSWAVLATAGALAVATLGCSETEGAARAAARRETDGTATPPSTEAERRAQQAKLDREFPLHGEVTGLQLTVRARPDAEADPVGWLRIGNRPRLSGPPRKSGNCATGWYRVHPVGYACAGQGIEVHEKPPREKSTIAPPRRDEALPYTYWFVKEPLTPEYHRLPSRDEQRAAQAVADRYLELVEEERTERATKLLAGELEDEPPIPAVVHRYLDRGFFVAGAGVEVRAFRRFVRTVRDRFVKQVRLSQPGAPGFTGVELGEERELPVAWMVRTGTPMTMKERADGTLRWRADPEAEPRERHTLLSDWVARKNIGGRFMHELDHDRYLRDWFVAVAQRVDPPAGIEPQEPWVHVDLSMQTLVLYEGDSPRFATLVSTGEEDHETPVGTFTIRRKYLADTMANIGDGQDDRYSIEDVPWTQYFDGSFALHGAFWHERFGLVRSHGCVNLSPPDARRVFDALWPRVPEGWLGVSTDRGTFRASRVKITE